MLQLNMEDVEEEPGLINHKPGFVLKYEQDGITLCAELSVFLF